MTNAGMQRWVLAAVMVGLAALLAVGNHVRRLVVEDWVGYLPREHQVLVVSGELASLWAAIDDHFGFAIRDEDRSGWLASLASTLDEPFREAGVPIRSVADLERHGFDPSGKVAWSLGAPEYAEPSVFLVFPVADRQRMRDWFATLQGDVVPRRHTVNGPRGPVELLDFGDDTWLAFPDERVAILTDSRALLERSVTQHDAALRWWRNNDAVVDALVGLTGSGGKAMVHWSHGAAPLRSATAVLTLGDDRVTVDGTARLYRGGLQIVEDLLQGVAHSERDAASLWGEVAAVLTVEDEAISRYLRFAGRFPKIARFMERRYGGVLASLRDAAGLERASVAMTGYRDGLPEIVLTLEGDREALERTVRRQQRRLAEQRDRAVLDGAIRAWMADGRDPAGLTVAVLTDGGWLEPDTAWGAYTIVADRDGVRVDGAPSPGRFDGEAYARRGVRFLAPPRNANDVRYLLEVEDGEAVDVEAFLSDRFRLATEAFDGGLRIATDALALLDGAAGDRMTGPPVWEGLRDGDDGAKAWLGVDTALLIEAGLLTAETSVQDWTRHYLMDFVEHPAGLVRWRTDPVAGTVQLELTLARGDALGDPR